MPGKRSRNKGKCGERDAAKALKECLGLDARRGQQYSGVEGRDVVCKLLLDTHIEVKRCEALRLREAIAQAERDAAGKVPLVLHRWNHGEWIAIVPLSELKRLAVQILSQE